MLNKGCWNVPGLNKQKIESGMFIDLSSKFDNLCVVETMLRESPENLPGNSSPILVLVASTKTKRKGWSSGGLQLFIKPEVGKHIELMTHGDYYLWIKVIIMRVNYLLITFILLFLLH